MIAVNPGRTVCAPRRVLVIEDNRDGRQTLALLLSLLGHKVEVAADGAEGVRKALDVHPEVAIIDIGLPRLDGYQVARRLRQALGPSAVLIAYTAYAPDRDDRRAGAADFDAWLVKPAGLEELTPWLGLRCLTSRLSGGERGAPAPR